MSKRAALSVVRSPGQSAYQDPKVVLPKNKPIEPDWDKLFPITAKGDPALAAEVRRIRKIAHEIWHRWVEDLTAAGVLSRLHSEVLADAVTCVARIEQCERNISLNGITVLGASGSPVQNRAVTVVGQYRQALRGYIKMLGLAPGAEIPGPGVPDDDNVWDD